MFPLILSLSISGLRRIFGAIDRHKQAALRKIYGAVREKRRQGGVLVGMRGDPIGIRCSFGPALALALLCMAGCASSDSQFSMMMFADPGKYQYKTCDEIATAALNAAARQKQLRELIAKADQGAGGAVVSTLAYRGEYRSVSEELTVIESTARAKKCVTSVNWGSRDVIR